MFSETLCLLLHSNTKVRPVDGSIMLLIGDACWPPDFEDEETAMEWGMSLPSPVTQWAVTLAEQGLNLWSPTCFSHPWSLKVVVAVPLRMMAPGPAAASGRSQLAAVERNLQVLSPVTMFHWWLEKCHAWCAQPTDGGGSLRLNLGSWAPSLQVSKWRQFG